MPKRIYALAKELAMDSKELVDLCTKIGIQNKGSALASLEDDEVERIAKYLKGGDAPRAAAAPSASAASGPQTIAPIPPAAAGPLPPRRTGPIPNLNKRAPSSKSSSAPLAPAAVEPAAEAAPAEPVPQEQQVDQQPDQELEQVPEQKPPQAPPVTLEPPAAQPPQTHVARRLHAHHGRLGACTSTRRAAWFGRCEEVRGSGRASQDATAKTRAHYQLGASPQGCASGRTSAEIQRARPPAP